MKQIQLNKGFLSLPERWEDLTPAQKLFAFSRLREVFDKRLSPAMFRIEVLVNITGYKPRTGFWLWVLKMLFYFLSKLVAVSYLFLKLGSVRFSGYYSVWRDYHRPRRYDRDTINYNLYKLSEQLDFAFSLSDHTVTEWKRAFADNPIPYLKIRGQKFTGKKFQRGVAPFTNITAREFSDCFDLYRAYLSASDSLTKEACLDKLISILYPATSNYRENLVSDHLSLINITRPEMKFGILFWFSGIVEFYLKHPIYSLLFRSGGTSETSDDKISLGMNEVVLMVKKHGYDTNDNVNDFFDAQIKILKDNLSEAIASGAKIDVLSDKSGLSMSEINRLI